MSESILPEEILHSVVESLAYNADFVERNLLRLRWKNATNELFSFSVACHQFRRISLPFLLSYIEIQRLEDLEMFKDQCILNASFAGSIRSLSVLLPSPWRDAYHTNNMMKHLLCYLKDLSQLVLNIDINISLLAHLNRHSLSNIIVTSFGQLPETSNSLDLEKIILADATIDGLDGGYLKGHLACGMQVRRLGMRQDLMVNSSGTHIFNGLYEIEVELRTLSFSWLPEFTRAHPLLKKISFTDSFDFPISHNAIPFIQPLFETFRQQGVHRAVRIQGFSVTRTSASTSTTDLTRDWEVTGLHLRQVADSLVLPIVHSVFPRISTLTLERGCSCIDELITFLRPFSSLQVLTLRFCFQHLELGHPGLANHPHVLAGPVETEAAMIRYISCIARKIPSIEAFYIEERQESGVDESWTFRGWIDARKGMTEVPAMIPSSRQRVGRYMATYISQKHSSTTFFI
ncbi:hypothetical protein BT96DRAFT_318214 [Gymnopus androsaceus JB14]|uniref:Uncharacterized protein n=1 Tax=Gymnopus androsaceus JB14 TaxID=1447944 RepID=A0A6A4H0I2_9AGAR|nr:hypothetical protein BT96DRAFT_318214 [Gymnopus androsaceus JB14]